MGKTNPAAGPRFWDTLYEQLQTQLQGVANSEQSFLQRTKNALDISRMYVRQLHSFISKYNFSNKSEEIAFYKSCRPAFEHEFIYYLQLYNILLREPPGGISLREQYYKKELSKIVDFYREHQDFYVYYRSEASDRDDQWFLQHTILPDLKRTHTPLPPYAEMNSGAYLVARILANDRLEAWLTQALEKPVPGHSTPLRLHWTASKVALIELVYALQAAGVFNQGKATIKEIVAHVEQVFQMDLGNYYNSFNEMRLRKKDRLPLLTEMHRKVLERMNLLDLSSPINK